jgi:Ala-tRNA(Pro) deacylase
MLARQIKKFLDDHHIHYKTIPHTPAYTAQEIASLAHISGRELAKTVMVKIDGKLAMVIEPANSKVNLRAFKELIGASNVELASEYDFSNKFPECETGAMPPFGNLYDMDVFIEDDLTRDKTIAFNAGSHSELIQMSYKDFAKLVKPTVIHAH